MQKRFLLKTLVVGALLASTGLMAQEKFKIGLILPMTGPFASTGKQIEAAAKLYMAQNGDMVAGKKVELIVKDDTSAPDVTKRIAQELVVNDKVSVLAGFGLTPLALATAPIATQSKTPLVVMAAATSSITEASPFVIRTSFALPQAAVGLADWAPRTTSKRSSHWCLTTAQALTQKNISKSVLLSTVVKSLTPCACRCAILTSPLSCKRCAMPSQMLSMCSYPQALARPS
jgi:branched-chain amino acid transport system substrate-binding protein